MKKWSFYNEKVKILQRKMYSWNKEFQIQMKQIYVVKARSFLHFIRRICWTEYQ